MTWTRDEFEARLKSQGSAYHIHHPFNVMLNSGRASREQIQGWVANRFYYQINIPIKDAAILANCNDRSVRRNWVQRILDHDGYGDDPGGIESWLRLGEAVGLSRDEVSKNRDCPKGTHVVLHAPGEMATDRKDPLFSHYFTSVDLPLAPASPEKLLDDQALDAFGAPLGLRARQRLLLKSSFDFSIGDVALAQGRIEIPIAIENVGAGHRVPAGFSQEREIWVELQVTDARGAVVYEVGKVASAQEDLHDKTFLRVTTSDQSRDFLGRPLGVFGADVVDGADLPEWSPNPNAGGSLFVGRGLVNFQNGFLRCVRCIGVVDENGQCNAVGEQARTRAGKFEDGGYDVDTGQCSSNLSGGNEFFETYFPVGALDADRGILKAPDAIIDTRSAPPGVPLVYKYEIDSRGHPPPFEARATLHFRAFPPYLIRAFAAYEAERATRGERPNGPQVTVSMLDRLEILDLAEARARIQ